ncbi:MAG TPA: PAS domain S-box protein, partial [Planctomycetota bacterium]|nr:PAS domain S-box protein [Planctomycetota bacterium]
MQLALSAGQLGDWSWDVATDLVHLGARAASIYRMARATTVSWPQLRELFHPEDRERAAVTMQAALRERTDYDIEFRLNRTSGEDVWIGAKGQVIYNEAGIASGMSGVVADISEKKKLELAQTRLVAIIESSDDAIVSKDLDGTVRTWNRGAQRVFGYTAAEMIGKPILKLIPPELRDEEKDILQRQRNGERVDHYETVRLTKDGRRIDVSLTVSPIRDSSGRIVGASKVARDITARKLIEAETRRSEEELRALADTIPQLAWMAKPDGSIFWFNQGWYEYTGTTPEQVEGWGWQSVHDSTVLPRVLELWRHSLQTGEPFEMDYPLRGADGTFRWFLTRVRPIRDASGGVIRWIGTSTDVHEVKRAQEALAEESRLLNLINETGKSIAADLDLETLVQKITDATTQISGAEFGAFFYNDRDEAGDSFQLFTLSGADRAVFEGFGQPRATPLFSPTFHGQESVRSDDVQLDERYGKWGGMPLGHLPVRSYLATAVVSRNGEVIGGLFFGHSTPGVFTERVERIITGIAAQAAVAIDNARLYERVKRAAEDRQELLEAERSARAESERVNFMKDEFLATLSHELRTPLNAIVGWSQVLRMRGHADPEVLEGLSVIDRNARVQAQLIEDLLDMSRIISGKVRLDVQRVDVQDVVRAAIASVRHSADSKSIRIQVVLDPQAGPVRGDPSRLQQCFWNLLSNAIKFTPKGGRVQVSLARVNSQVEIAVVDNGQGIDPQFLPHVFERFRQADGTTTRFHGGLGLGLSIVKSIIELHGGSVHAHSAGLGQGATFTIELPVMVLGESAEIRHQPDSQAQAQPPSQLDHPSLKGITVLAVDDEPDARGLVKRVLEDCGARVLVAASVQAALDILQHEKPDILISDIGMPDEDGYSLIRRVRKLPPELGGRIPAAALSAFAR